MWIESTPEKTGNTSDLELLQKIFDRMRICAFWKTFEFSSMKRDMDTVRDLLRRAEAANGSVSINDPVETYHVRIMIEAGLLEGRISEEITSDSPRHSYIHNLTWTGHEFLDAARDDTVWRKAHEKILKPGVSFTFDLLKEALKNYAKEQLKRIGLPGFDQ